VRKTAKTARDGPAKATAPARERRPGERNPALTAAAILDAATREFTEHGYGGARINEIAKRARINKRMLYHYYGGKEALYLAVLEAAYVGIRSAEAELNLKDRDPADAMCELALFTWRYFLDHPEFLSLLNTENLLKAKHLKKSRKIVRLHSPLVALIGKTLERGAAAGEFRRGVDPVDLYISIAALGFFYISNRFTLSTIFRRDLFAAKALEHRGEHIVDFVMAYLRPVAPARLPPVAPPPRLDEGPRF
jgi:TetR/AcrR family transcriptional regulator